MSSLRFNKHQQLVRCEEFRKKWLSLQNPLRKQAEVVVCPSFTRAIEYLLRNKEYNILVTGSLFLVGAALSVLNPTLDGVFPD